MSKSKTLFVKDLKEKDLIRTVFLIKHSATAMGKNGKPYMNLVFSDRTGDIEAKVWDQVERHSGQLIRDAFVEVEGKVQLFQGRRQLVVQEAQIIREDEIELNDYLAPAKVEADPLYAQLVSFVESMEDPFYKALAEAVLVDDEEIVEKLKRAPAAKSVHHAYRGGLIEHIVSVTGLLNQVSQHYGTKLNRDLLFLGGFFHDICKIWELSYDRVTDYTDEGRLLGHLVMGVELVEKKIQWLESIPGRIPGKFPTFKKLLVKHLIVSHHGLLEYGSPKTPQVLEALIVHMIDDLDSKMNGIFEFMKADQNPGKWTLLNKQFERYFLKNTEL